MLEKIFEKFFKKSENLKESYFTGEHFEAHGDRWKALFGDTEKFISEYLSFCINKGELFFNKKTVNKNYSGIIYSENDEISILSLIEVQKKQNVYASSIPVFKGSNNTVKLKEYYTWEVEGEGEFAAETSCGNIINFFDPFYAIDKEKFEVNKNQSVSLAGLAYSLEKLEEKEFIIDHGPSYEFFKKEFLNKNPDKTEADFESPVLKLDAEHFKMMCFKEYACEYEIAAQIEEIHYIELFDEKLTMMKVSLEPNEENKYINCYIYASKHVLGEYNPKVGDGIHGIIWLTGFFN